MRLRLVILLQGLLLLCTRSNAQLQAPPPPDNLLTLGNIWSLSSLAGEIKGGGLYAQATSSSYGENDKAILSNLYGGVSLRTMSYFWDPNFITLGVDGGYYPQTMQDQFVIYQNRHDVINTKNLHLTSALFPKKKINLSVFANFDQMYDSRENLTDIKTNSQNLGSYLSLSNKYVPLFFDVNKSEWHQTELQTNRNFNYEQTAFDGRASKTFFKDDRNELLYSHRDYTRQDYNLSPVRNLVDIMELHDNYYLDSIKRSRLSSSIVGMNQRGVDSFKQIHVSEGVFYVLPHDFILNSNYSFYYVTRPSQDLRQHDVNANIGHQLYESLFTSISGDFNYADETQYVDQIYNLGANIVYNKKILRKGQLSVNYSYNRLHDKRLAQDVLLQVVQEGYTLTDNQIVLIKLPFVDEATVLVKDSTDSHLYQKDIDYVLIPDGNYLEIRRQPGGQIANGMRVYVSYTARQPGNSKYDVNQQNFSIDITFFKRLIGAYYRINKTDYVNVENIDPLFLNYLTNTYYGLRSEYKFFSGGAEVNNYQSTLYPYRMFRYYAILQGHYKKKILYSLNGNIRYYDHLQNGEISRKFNDVSGMLAYLFNSRTRLDFNLIYNYQNGEQIDLEMYTGKLKLTTAFRDITCSAGIDAYHRIYLETQKYYYIGGFIEIIKRFKY